MYEQKYELPSSPTIASLASVPMQSRKPVENEILVRIEASSLNFHDYLVVTGAIKVDEGRVPLSDGVGIVESCGPDVHRFKPGQRVMGTFFPDWIKGGVSSDGVALMRGDHVDGFAASTVTLPESGFTHVPSNLDPLTAATLPCAGLTAWRALFDDGKLLPGETVLVQGTGGVSIFALQFAKAAGARVIATTGCPSKVDKLYALGADTVIDRMDPEWGMKAYAATNEGVDHVVEVAGGDLTQSLQSLRIGGRMCLVGVLSRKPIQIGPAQLIHANRRISGITVGSRAHQEAMIRAVEHNQIMPQIDQIYSIESLGEAFEYFARQQHFGKIAVDFRKPV